MNRRLPQVNLPTWRSPVPDLVELANWRREITRILTSAFNRIVGQLNSQVQGVGENLNTSSNTITVTDPIHRVSGTGTIEYIYTTIDTVGASDETTATQGPSFTGPLFLVATGAWSTSNAGVGTWRIASPNMTVTANTVVIFVFDGDAWYHAA